MGRIKDLSGQQFGRLIVIKDSGKRTKSRHVIWECKCSCGNIHLADGVELQRKNIQSCGCLGREIALKNLKDNRVLAPNKTNYSGYRSGKLVAISPTSQRTSSGNIIWKCQCDCGNICFVSTSDLKSNSVQSCGCLRSIGELNISSILEQNNVKYKSQYSFSDCLSPKQYKLYFDFAIFDSNNKLSHLIEFDGEQHLTPVSIFGGKEQFNYLKSCDNIKDQYCRLHSIPLIRIPYNKRDTLTINDLILKTGENMTK